MKLKLKYSFASLLIVCVFVSSFVGVGAVFAAAPPRVSGAVSAGLGYLDSVQGFDGVIDDFVVSCWATMAIVAAGEDPDSGRWLNGGGSVVDYLIANDDLVNVSDAFDVERFVLAMVAAGENPSNVAGVDYLSILKGFFDGTQIGEVSSLRDDFWGVLALVSAGESPSSVEVQGSVSFIKANQNVDGGWSWSVVNGSSVDDTSAAVMALMCAGEDGSSQAVKAAVQYLKGVQFTTGGFSFNVAQVVWLDEDIIPYDYTYSNLANCISSSYVSGAIVAVGGHPGKLPEEGPTVVSYLLSLRNADGSFNYKINEAGSSLALMTCFAVQALCYRSYPVNVVSLGPYLAGDFTGDQAINFDDITGFVDAYIDYYKSGYVTVPGADFDGNGRVDFDDITDFVDEYISFYSAPEWVSVDLCLGYGGGTVVWYNNTLLPVGSNFKELTEAVAYVNATWWYSYQSFFIDAIDGVWSNEHQCIYWMWAMWDEVDQQWELGPCGADRWILSDGEMLKWQYRVSD